MRPGLIAGLRLALSGTVWPRDFDRALPSLAEHHPINTEIHFDRRIIAFGLIHGEPAFDAACAGQFCFDNRCFF